MVTETNEELNNACKIVCKTGNANYRSAATWINGNGVIVNIDFVAEPNTVIDYFVFAHGEKKYKLSNVKSQQVSSWGNYGVFRVEFQGEITSEEQMFKPCFVGSADGKEGTVITTASSNKIVDVHAEVKDTYIDFQFTLVCDTKLLTLFFNWSGKRYRVVLCYDYKAGHNFLRVEIPEQQPKLEHHVFNTENMGPFVSYASLRNSAEKVNLQVVNDATQITFIFSFVATEVDTVRTILFNYGNHRYKADINKQYGIGKHEIVISMSVAVFKAIAPKPKEITGLKFVSMGKHVAPLSERVLVDKNRNTIQAQNIDGARVFTIRTQEPLHIAYVQETYCGVAYIAVVDQYLKPGEYVFSGAVEPVQHEKKFCQYGDKVPQFWETVKLCGSFNNVWYCVQVGDIYHVQPAWETGEKRGVGRTLDEAVANYLGQSKPNKLYYYCTKCQRICVEDTDLPVGFGDKGYVVSRPLSAQELNSVASRIKLAALHNRLDSKLTRQFAGLYVRPVDFDDIIGHVKFIGDFFTYSVDEPVSEPIINRFISSDLSCCEDWKERIKKVDGKRRIWHEGPLGSKWACAFSGYYFVGTQSALNKFIEKVKQFQAK